MSPSQSTIQVSVLFSEPKIPQYTVQRRRVLVDERFQCSSASRKFLNDCDSVCTRLAGARFQCSSASRKFLNRHTIERCGQARQQFQCSSASRKFLNRSTRTVDERRTYVSVLFSEPKIPQFTFRTPPPAISISVSVLFSEPKIPQSIVDRQRSVPLVLVSVLFSEPKIPQSRPSHLRPSIFPTAMITLRHS